MRKGLIIVGKIIQMNLPKIKNISDTKSEIRFDGEIVSSEWDKWENVDTCPEDVLNVLKSIDENAELDIYINSGGGSVFAGIAIYNMLARHKGKKTVYVDGLAGSIASVIAMAGDEIIMPSNSYLMIHKPLCGCCGNANDMRKMADTLDSIETGILNTYKTKLKDSVELDTIKNMVNDETWLTGEEASKFFDIVVTTGNKAVARIDKDYGYKNTPKALIETVEIKDKENIELEKTKLLLELDLI